MNHWYRMLRMSSYKNIWLLNKIATTIMHSANHRLELKSVMTIEFVWIDYQ